MHWPKNQQHCIQRSPEVRRRIIQAGRLVVDGEAVLSEGETAEHVSHLAKLDRAAMSAVEGRYA